MTEYDLEDATTVRPKAMPTTPIRKNTLLSQLIFSVRNGTTNLTVISTPPSTDMASEICAVVKPKSFKMNGVNIEKFNSPKLMIVSPATKLTKVKSRSRSKSKKVTSLCINVTEDGSSDGGGVGGSASRCFSTARARVVMPLGSSRRAFSSAHVQRR